jgi:hypothetical protein
MMIIVARVLQAVDAPLPKVVLIVRTTALLLRRAHTFGCTLTHQSFAAVTLSASFEKEWTLADVVRAHSPRVDWGIQITSGYSLIIFLKPEPTQQKSLATVQGRWLALIPFESCPAVHATKLVADRPTQFQRFSAAEDPSGSIRIGSLRSSLKSVNQRQ